MRFPCPAWALTQPEPRPLMTHLAENHEANCQTEKQGEKWREWSPYSLRSSAPLVAASSCNAAAGVHFGAFKPESCYCFKGDDRLKCLKAAEMKLGVKATAKGWQRRARKVEDLLSVWAVPRKIQLSQKHTTHQIQGMALPPYYLEVLSGIIMIFPDKQLFF